MAISKILAKNPITAKTWYGQSVPLDVFKMMASFIIPAGTKALIIGNTGNGIGTSRRNTCNFEKESGTANVFYNGVGLNNSAAGNRASGWCYVEAETTCKINVRQYGYEQALSGTADGYVVAIALYGGYYVKHSKPCNHSLSERKGGGRNGC